MLGKKRQATIGHLTGSKRITKGSGFFNYQLNDRPRRSVLNMFIAPYESRAEFEFCAIHTIIPALVLTCSFFLNPAVLVIVPLVYLTMIAVSFLIEKIAESCGLPTLKLVASETKESSKQVIFDFLTLPVSTVMLITRSFSTIISKLFSCMTSEDEHMNETSNSSLEPCAS